MLRDPAPTDCPAYSGLCQVVLDPRAVFPVQRAFPHHNTPLTLSASALAPLGDCILTGVKTMTVPVCQGLSIAIVRKARRTQGTRLASPHTSSESTCPAHLSCISHTTHRQQSEVQVAGAAWGSLLFLSESFSCRDTDKAAFEFYRYGSY